ncbi:MAG: cellulase family glycosylhydrolase [Anaerolineales bacterium]
MKTYIITIFLGIFILAACTPTPTSTPEEVLPAALPIDTPTPTALPEGRTIFISNPSDSGPGTLRQALEDAGDYDTITFDPAVFPPDVPVTIFITSELPHIRVSHLTLDASNAGVVLDGSQIPGDWVAGLQIVSSEANTIKGMQISHFPGPGIGISGIATNNVIGGDQGVGAGPWGQGNLLTNNVTGIDLTVSGTKLNTITGNLIGSDLEGTDGLSNDRGVTVWEGANRNTVGPNNIIANNREGGVVIFGRESHHITITQNSIYENNENDIWLEGDSNQGVTFPIVFDYDISVGTVTGVTCANCIVEIFSSSSSGGEIYEGQITADEVGSFIFDKGVSFSGPTLTATNTDIDGNTSEFSRPTSGTARTLNMQQENDFPKVQIIHKSFDDMADNHIGVWFEDHKRYYDTDFVYRNGFKRIRIGSLYGEGQWWGTIINSDSLSDEVDQTISEYADDGMEIVLILAPGAGVKINYLEYDTTFKSEEEIERYLEFVSFVVSHFKGRIQGYEILNEPGYISVETYANLVKATVPVIRGIDPDAKIIIGAIHGDWVNGYPGYGEYQRFSVAMGYLNGLLRSGVVQLVDGISWHPMYDNIPSDPYYQDYPELVQSIKDLATSQGFTGEYFADEMLWTTVDEPDWDNGPPVSQLIAAKYYTRTITEHRGLGVNVTIQTFFQVPFVEPIHNLADRLAGAEPADFPLSLASEAVNMRHYSFVLPNGDGLVALWTNGIPVEDDPGIETAITIPGFSAREVTGIDVLYGFEQELNFEVVDGALIINNLLIKDYPILIKLSQ